MDADRHDHRARLHRRRERPEDCGGMGSVRREAVDRRIDCLEGERMSDDKPLLLTEIAAWARAWLDTHERHRALGAELVGEEKIDLDIRAMRQVAETFERLCI